MTVKTTESNQKRLRDEAKRRHDEHGRRLKAARQRADDAYNKKYPERETKPETEPKTASIPKEEYRLHMKRQSGFFHEFFDEEYPDQETKPKTASISSKEGYRLEGEKQPDTLIGLFCKLIELSLAVIGIYVGETRRHYKELLRQNEGKTDAELEDVYCHRKFGPLSKPRL